MNFGRRVAKSAAVRRTILLAGLIGISANVLIGETPGTADGAAQAVHDPSRPMPQCKPAAMGSPYIPVDSWVYPALWRLYGLGFLDHIFLNLRPYTRNSVSNMLDQVGAKIDDADPGPATDEAEGIYDALLRELTQETTGPCGRHAGQARMDSVYTQMRGISGTPLNDSFHLGQTIVNDYGRPYSNGFNNYTGASGYVSAGRFVLAARGEFQGTPSAAGYSLPLAQTLSQIDLVTFINPATGLPFNQATIPLGPISSMTNGRWMQAYAAALVMNHMISFGKTDVWMSPAQSLSMAYSNNAENIYSFRINRVEPLRIPWLSYLTGPFRYDFLVGSLKGHTSPNDPWVHAEKISFRPTENLEFGFERTVIWGGKDHVPITLHSFLKSFFSFSGVNSTEKFSRNDPGARFGQFDFSYRLPFLRKWLTLYTDSNVHDDIVAADAPRRGSWWPGIYLSHFPGASKLDLRAEAGYTDPPVGSSQLGRLMYWESVQVQGYTNKGHNFGPWVGREGKGGEGWLTYHLSGNEWLQASYRNFKVAKDFVPGGVTLNDVSFQAVKRIGHDFEVNGAFTYQGWKAPIYNTGVPVYPAPQHTVTVTAVQLTWFPTRKVSF